MPQPERTAQEIIADHFGMSYRDLRMGSAAAILADLRKSGYVVIRADRQVPVFANAEQAQRVAAGS
jgi:hypothetical protein